MTPDWEKMIERAAARASGSARPEGWGEPIELEEASAPAAGDGGVFRGRYRGQEIDQNFDRLVYLFWDERDEPRFMRHRARLGQEMENRMPAVGDYVVIVRDVDYQTSTGNSGHTYGVYTAPCTDPLPDEAGQAEAGIPF